MGNLEGFKTLVEEVTANGMDTASEVELAAGPEGVTELLQSHGKSATNEELLLINGQKKLQGFLRQNLLLVKVL